MRQWKSFAMVALLVAALGLAGCGGGGGGSAATEPETTPMPDPAIAQRAAVNTAINTARTVVAGLTDDASDTEIGSADAAVAAAKQAVTGASALDANEMAAFNTTIAVIEDNLGTKKASIMAAREDAADKMKEAMAETGKALRAALAGTSATTNALSNIAAPTLSSAGLLINANADAGTFTGGNDPDGADGVTLKAGASAGSLDGWSGTDYALSTGTGATKVTNEARVYINQGAPRSVSFATAGYTVATETTGTAIKGYVEVVTSGSVNTGFAIGDVMANAFTHSGIQTHQKADRADALYIHGTYDGAPGEYRCATGCSSTNDGKGSPSALGGTWHFKPDAGAMVSQPDTNYLYFGWWVSKNNDGEPTAASAFANIVGTITALTTNPDALTGSAKYAGPAAGKFAMSNVLEGTGNGGHFTADVSLEATFGAGTTAGMKGKIDGFRLNDGSEDPGWSVELERAGWDSSAATFGGSGNEAATVWSINGNKADASGAWSGTMYDEMPGDPPGGDGSNIPTTVTGTFYSEFSTIGRMVGAFGATRTE